MARRQVRAVARDRGVATEAEPPGSAGPRVGLARPAAPARRPCAGFWPRPPGAGGGGGGWGGRVVGQLVCRCPWGVVHSKAVGSVAPVLVCCQAVWVLSRWCRRHRGARLS